MGWNGWGGHQASRGCVAGIAQNVAMLAASLSVAQAELGATTNVDHVYPFQVLLAAASTGLARDSKAQAEQVRSVAVERVGKQLGFVPAPVMLDVDEALRIHLAL